MDTVGIWATSLLVMLGVTTNDTLGGGWTEQTPYQLKKSKDRAPWESQRM
mgnify:CR=1 FL=1